MDAFYNFILAAGDLCFGWLLSLPSDVSLLAVAVITSVVFVVVRLFTVDQELGRCCSADKKRLKVLIKEAKAAHDKHGVNRYRATVGRIGMKLMKMEVKPTLVALLPVTFLALWACERLDCFPPKAHEQVEVSFHYPVSACQRIAHLAPLKGVVSEGGWIKRFDEEEGDPLAAMAVWKLRFDQVGSYKLKFRFDDKTYEHEVLVGARYYMLTMQLYPENKKIASVIRLPQRMLFGIVPGYAPLGCKPWMVGYLLLTVPLVFINKALFRIA